MAPPSVWSYDKCPLARLCTMSTRTAMPKLTIDTQYGIIIIQDLETVFVSEYYAHLYGYSSASELLNSIDSFLDLIESSYHPQATDNYHQTLKGDVLPRGRTFRNRDRNGREFSVFAIDHVIEWNGKPALQVTVIDLSAQERAQLQLQENERKFKQLITKSGQGISVHRDFKPIFVNQAWVDLMRAPSIDAVLRDVNLLSFLPEEEHANAQSRYQSLISGRLSGAKTVVKNRCFDGEIRYFCVYDNLIEWDGKPAVQAVIEDVTDRITLEAKLRQLSVTDPLTDVYNRRELDRVLDQEFQRGQRYSHPFAVILIDIDHFKVINDTYGHDAGDNTLRAIANTLRDTLRQTDVLGRWGGEEFLIVCPSTDLTGASHLANTLRSRIANLALDDSKPVTISIGVASLDTDDTQVSDVLKRADLALYDAKRNGRNQVKVDRP